MSLIAAHRFFWKWNFQMVEEAAHWRSKCFVFPWKNLIWMYRYTKLVYLLLLVSPPVEFTKTIFHFCQGDHKSGCADSSLTPSHRARGTGLSPHSGLQCDVHWVIGSIWHESGIVPLFGCLDVSYKPEVMWECTFFGELWVTFCPVNGESSAQNEILHLTELENEKVFGKKK